MASTVQLLPGMLLDIVDDEWMKETLPDDGEWGAVRPQG